jgi:hypothetical protein
MARGAASSRGGDSHDAAILDEHLAADLGGLTCRCEKGGGCAGATGCDRNRGATAEVKTQPPWETP